MKKVNGRYGEVWYFDWDQFVGASVEAYGEFSPEESKTILELSGNGLCLDIGANIGCIGQMLEANGKKVVSFEPQPEVFKLLEKNVRGEKHNVALGRQAGVAYMPKVDYTAVGNFGGLGCVDKAKQGFYQVPMKALDSYDFQDVSFIKIDVEGFEREVLMGAKETIRKWKPVLYIEDDRPEKRERLRNYINYLGYTFEEDNPPLYSPDNFFGRRENIWNRNFVSMNLICRHVDSK